jgi:hypothetical protein
MSLTVVCYPVSDLGPNDGVRFGAATAFDCLAQDPHDGDTTRIKYSASMQQNVCGVDWSAIPTDAHVVSVTVRWTEAGTSTSSQAQGGLRDIVVGDNNYGPLRSLSPHSYSQFNETFSVNPESGLGWRRSDLDNLALAHLQGSLDSELQYPRLTALVAVVIYDPAPVHDEGSAESLGVAASASGGPPHAAAIGNAPDAAASSLAQSGSGSGQGQDAAAQSLAPSGASSGQGARGAGTSIQGCTAIAASLAPIGECAPLSPSASAVWLIPEIGDAQ